MPSIKHVDQSIDAIKRELEALDAKLNRGNAMRQGDAARHANIIFWSFYAPGSASELL